MRRSLYTLLAACAVAACGSKPAPQPDVRPRASIQELMQSIVDPAADSLWDAVSTTVSTAGVDEHQPRTAEQWLELRHHAIRLVEAATLLVADGRVVAHPGHTLEDSHVQGILAPAQIEARIRADPAAFAQRAGALQQAAAQALQAVEARDVARLLEAGARLDQACEACHQTYWYPNDKRPGR